MPGYDNLVAGRQEMPPSPRDILGFGATPAFPALAAIPRPCTIFPPRLALRTQMGRLPGVALFRQRRCATRLAVQLALTRMRDFTYIPSVPDMLHVSAFPGAPAHCRFPAPLRILAAGLAFRDRTGRLSDGLYSENDVVRLVSRDENTVKSLPRTMRRIGSFPANHRPPG
jgi:hypothetical protein